PSQQSHGDRVEADRTADASGEFEFGAEHLCGAAEAGQRTGDDHDQDRHLRHGDAAVRAACGFAPTALNSNPIVERSSSHHTKMVARTARTKPTWRRNGAGRSRNICAESSTTRDCGFAEVVWVNQFCLSRYPSAYPAIALSMIVTIPSLAPVRALRTPAMPAQTAPPMMPPMTAMSMWTNGGRSSA